MKPLLSSGPKKQRGETKAVRTRGAGGGPGKLEPRALQRALDATAGTSEGSRGVTKGKQNQLQVLR